MTVVALALGIGLHLQFALAFWLAVVAALSVYVALLSTHILVRRSDYVDELRRELVRLEAKAGPSIGPSQGTAQPITAGYQPPRRPGEAPASTKGMGDYWSFTPAAAAGIVPIAPAAAMHVATPHPAPDAAAHQRDADAQQINAVIKKLAADITQGQAALERAPEPSLAPVAIPVAMSLPSPQQIADIDDSVAALHAAADAMREASQVTERALPARSGDEGDEVEPLRHLASAPPPLPPTRPDDLAHSRLAAVAEALERERFDVMLEPILGLDDRRAQHYLVSVRLRDGLDGLSNERSAPGSGLLPLLDAVKVESAARVAWRMEDRAKPGALFSQLSGESLVSDRFLNRFADTYRQGDTLSGRLVLSFRQSELRTFSEPQWSTLRDMADLGFRFCVEEITTLDQDFAALAVAGFTFVRLEADVFLEGLPAERGLIPASDICRHFAGHALAVIVSGIADEAVSQKLQSYGVELGQGGLFGSARPVKADVLRNPHAAVA